MTGFLYIILKEILVYQMPKNICYAANGVKLFETPRTREYLLIFLHKKIEI